MEEHDRASVESSLRLGSGFEADERAGIVAGWSSLTSRLGSFPRDAVDLELSVKERATPSQRTVLQAWIAGSERLVATSEESDLDTALTKVRDELIRQLTDAKNRSEPRNRRSLRETIRDDE